MTLQQDITRYIDPEQNVRPENAQLCVLVNLLEPYGGPAGSIGIVLLHDKSERRNFTSSTVAIQNDR